MGLVEKEKRRPRGSRAPLPPMYELDKEGGRPPFPFFPLFLLPQVLIQLGKGGGGVLLPVGVGLLLRASS